MLEFILSEYRTDAQDVLAVIVCVAAIIWGGGPERIVAATWLIVFELASIVKALFYGDDVQLTDIDWFLASTDSVALVLFLSVALYANRNYTLWIAAMQLLAVTAHMARGLADLISPIAYAAMFIIPGWLQLLFLGVGLARHVARKRKHGAYRDWRARKPRIAVGGRPEALPSEIGLQGVPEPSWRDDLK